MYITNILETIKAELLLKASDTEAWNAHLYPPIWQHTFTHNMILYSSFYRYYTMSLWMSCGMKHFKQQQQKMYQKYKIKAAH